MSVSLLLITHLIILAHINCQKYTITKTSSDQFIRLTPVIGIEKDGVLEYILQTEPTNLPIFLTLYNYDQYSSQIIKQLTTKPLTGNFCRYSSISRYQIEGTFEAKQIIKVTDQYIICILNCYEQQISINGTIEFLNTGSNSYSMGERFLKYVYLFFIIAHFAVFAALFCLWLQNKKLYVIQKIITAQIIIKLFGLTIYVSQYWTDTNTKFYDFLINYCSDVHAVSYIGLLIILLIWLLG